MKPSQDSPAAVCVTLGVVYIGKEKWKEGESVEGEERWDGREVERV